MTLLFDKLKSFLDRLDIDYLEFSGISPSITIDFPVMGITSNFIISPAKNNIDMLNVTAIAPYNFNTAYNSTLLMAINEFNRFNSELHWTLILDDGSLWLRTSIVHSPSAFTNSVIMTALGSIRQRCEDTLCEIIFSMRLKYGPDESVLFSLRNDDLDQSGDRN